MACAWHAHGVRMACAYMHAMRMVYASAWCMHGMRMAACPWPPCLLRAGRALAVAVGEPLIDAVAAEGVAALDDDGIFLVLLAERALDHAAVVVDLLIGPAARPAAATGGCGLGEPVYLALQHVLLLLQPLDLHRLVA